MTNRTCKTGLLCRFGKRGMPLILGMMLGMLKLTAPAACPAGPEPIPEKGNLPMPQAASAPLTDRPALDTLEPARVETFTFGLG